MKPYETLPDTLTYDGQEYPLNLSYTAFFAVADILKDERLLYHEKLATALDIFIPAPHPLEPELLTAIYDLLKPTRPRPDGPTYLDVEQDWPYICAGFMQAYGIDLYTNKDMHILQWQALIQGLPKDTRLMDIISIRAAEIPTPNKYNAERIAELSRLKAVYAIQGTGENFQNGLASLFEMLEARAKGNT